MTEDEALFGISDEESQPALFSTENFKPKEERQSTVQPTLNELGAGYEYEPWKREWHDMPECENHEMKPYDSVVVRFANKEAQDDIFDADRSGAHERQRGKEHLASKASG